jgi:hypothetical protein
LSTTALRRTKRVQQTTRGKQGTVRSVGSSKKRAKRRAKALTPYYFDFNGQKIYLRPRQTYWYMMYVKAHALTDDKFNMKFRRRFRVPYCEYLKLLEKIKEEDISVAGGKLVETALAKDRRQSSYCYWGLFAFLEED